MENKQLKLYLLEEYEKYLEWISKEEFQKEKSDLYSLGIAYTFYLFFMTMPDYMYGMVELIVDECNENIYNVITDKYWSENHFFKYLNEDECYIFLKNMVKR